MVGIPAADSIYRRFVIDLISSSWIVVGPVVAADRVCRLQVLSADDDISLSVLPLIPAKKLLLPPIDLLWEEADGRYRSPSMSSHDSDGVAVLDLHPCDLYALAYLDQVYAEDPYYQRRRAKHLLVGRECQPASSCFCYPRDSPPPFDLFFAKDELWCGSDLGERLLQKISLPVSSSVRRPLPAIYWSGQVEKPFSIAERFLESEDHPLWSEVAERCLSCGSCSAVCPTCSCYDVVDEATLKGEIRRLRLWDNCFFRDHALVAGGENFRRNRRDRLRFRFEHKYLGFGAQRGVISCVGCGRCQRVCPVGIDLRQFLTVGGE